MPRGPFRLSLTTSLYACVGASRVAIMIQSYSASVQYKLLDSQSTARPSTTADVPVNSVSVSVVPFRRRPYTRRRHITTCMIPRGSKDTKRQQTCNIKNAMFK